MTEAASLIRATVRESMEVCQQMIESRTATLVRIANCLGGVLQGGGTVYLCGNGGSAADAQHVAAEFVGRFLRERRPLPAVALTTNTSILTAIGNDYDFNQIFSRQVRAQVTERDAVVGISTSGKSGNVLQALAAALERGAATVGFTGQPGEPLASSCQLCLQVPSALTPRIQEAHILAWHIVCDLIERRFAAHSS